MQNDIKLNHLAIIPDGNRRWAREKGLPETDGHIKGMETSIKIARYLRKIGVHTFTLWGCSTKNWARKKKEVAAILGLSKVLESYVKEAIKDEVRIIHIGRKDRLPGIVLNRIKKAEEKTAHLNKYVLNIAFDYGGQDEVLRAIQKMNHEARIMNHELTETNFEQYLDTAGQPYPNPDLIIRTSGEKRTSGFMIWQAAYSEYIFLDKFYPDLDEKD